MSRRDLTSPLATQEGNPFLDTVSDSESDVGGVKRSLSSGHSNMNNVNNNVNNIAAGFSKPFDESSAFSSSQEESSNVVNSCNSLSNQNNNINNDVNNIANNATSRTKYLNTPLLSLAGGSTSTNSNSNGARDAMVPPEFDRYPAIVNTQRLGLKSANLELSLAGHGRTYSSSSSAKSNTPFLIDSDFSPFGGYPASSFPLHIDEKEPDDYIHNPDPIEDAKYDHHRMLYDLRSLDKRSGWGLAGFLLLLAVAVVVFVLVPVFTYAGVIDHQKPETYEVLTQYKYPKLAALRTELVDPDTPLAAHTRKARDGSKWQLVFSDEFNKEGRTFYDGDDQFFMGMDFNYAATHDLEWYDPDAISTENGTLNLRMDAFKNHNLLYRSGMLQTWNRMCFTQGVIEVSAKLPNYGNVTGLWPGIWTMGNLGRPGYMATTEGVWPYSYEECDAGITPNQSSPDGISYLPGQKLSSCTCQGEDHPNRGTGRGAPEIDVLEAEVDTTLGVGVASQSLQIAPFDIWYYPDYEFVELYNDSISSANVYTGGPFQQAVSATSTLNTTWYQYGDTGIHQFQRFGFEYLNDNDNGYIQWFIGDDPTLTIHAKALHPNGNIGWRRISKEPMSIVLNLGISNNWAYIDWASLKFPVTMSIDYVRIYQPDGLQNLGCSPPDYPTTDYIQNHLNAYSNNNLTSWKDAGYSYPKNKLTGNCS